MRKVLTRLLIPAVVLILAVVGTDFGFAIFAEYRMARSVRTAAHLHFDPWVSILGFPFGPQAMRGRYQQVEVKAPGVAHPVVGKASIEATLYDMVATPKSALNWVPLTTPVTWPAPISPHSTALPIASKIGFASAKSLSVPPTMIASVPSIAFGSPPLTGASSIVAPRAAASAPTGNPASRIPSPCKAMPIAATTASCSAPPPRSRGFYATSAATRS